MSNPNLDILELVAHALGPVCDEVVFVGGCAASRKRSALRWYNSPMACTGCG